MFLTLTTDLEVDSDSDFANDDLIIAAHEPQKLKEGLSRRDTLSIITKKSRGRKPRQRMYGSYKMWCCIEQ